MVSPPPPPPPPFFTASTRKESVSTGTTYGHAFVNGSLNSPFAHDSSSDGGRGSPALCLRVYSFAMVFSRVI